MTFLLELWASPAFRKFLLYLAIAALAAWAFRQWLNKHDNIVFQQGKEAVAEEQRKKFDEALASERAKLTAEKEAISKVVDQLNRNMDRLQGSLNEAIKQSKVTQAGNASAAMSVPDTQINSVIRSELKRSPDQ